MALVTLVSGGLDSTLMSVLAKEEGIAIYPLFVDYGQLGVIREWEACVAVHRDLGLPEVTRIDLSGFGKLIGSGITNKLMRINEDAFLPGRNLLFLLCGAAFARTSGATGVAIGLLDPKDRIFPDQSEDFLKQSEDLIATTMGHRITVVAPLLRFSKLDVLRMSTERGLKGTYSCHAGEMEPCGKCISCQEIINARERS